MIQHDKKLKEHIIQQLLAHIAKHSPSDAVEPLSHFTQRFYGTISVDDLKNKEISDLFGVVFSVWAFISDNKGVKCKINAYNPSLEQHGWQSHHTVIEISHLDMPFLVDSVSLELNRMGFMIHLVIHSGCYYFERNEQGKMYHFCTEEEGVSRSVPPEAVMYIEIDRQDPQMLAVIEANLQRVLSDVAVAVQDWRPMCQVVSDCLVEMEQQREAFDVKEWEEAHYYLRWLLENHFTFLGTRQYQFDSKKQALALISGSGLGVLRESAGTDFFKMLADLPPRVRDMMLSNQMVIIAKTNTISTVHRGVYTDYVGIKHFKDGTVVGLTLVIGLYTSVVYNSHPFSIPFVRQKVESILKRSQLDPQGHAGKTLLSILETLPRDDLFQADVDDLYELSIGILQLQERQRTRLFVLRDPYNRYLSCLVYAPKDRVNTDFRLTVQQVLMKAVNGIDSSFSTQFSDSILARIHFLIRIDPKNTLECDFRDIEQHIIEATLRWEDAFYTHLVEYFGEVKGSHYHAKYKHAFTAVYQEQYPARIAVHDIERIEALTADNSVEISFHRTHDDFSGKLQLKIFSSECSPPLSDVLPMLENMGLRVLGEQPSAAHFSSGQTVWINDFQMIAMDASEVDIEAIHPVFKEAFLRMWFGQAENDRFNRLVLSAHLTWKETAVLRAYARYMKQVGSSFSQEYIANTLCHNPKIASQLIQLFTLRFNPDHQGCREDNLANLDEALKMSLDAVLSLDEDRILRYILKLIMATDRTNYFVCDAQGADLDYLSFKLNPNNIPDMPLPRPMHEIFIYSPRVEGVHLRGSKVARGGLRWSDRPEDFRTEVLGLMKAQQVKNALIVPSGAKGGFVPKFLPLDQGREAVLQEAIACYQIFIRGLLGITDNIVNGKTVTPARVVCYDEPDPYLVVAADKGTATFSDIANAISKEHHFWLGDAFASGGSAGYDHKKMAITARGAWESAKRNCREVLGIDIQTTDFTVVGVGDMAGDVFGNGMLCSQHIRLIAAFNHMHIFIDPNPDAARSYQERQRMFDLPRSGWDDYDVSCISAGGGIFKRSEKSIKLSPEIKAVLGIEEDALSPNDLIKAIIKAEVDMFYNGGIGTFVKSSKENHRDVGDRASDAIRVNANELRVKVIIEGGNLGMTQRARIEFAQCGGRVNTDFVDNSAGVNCSDHEVNIKILLNRIMANGDLTLKQRNELLAKMTEEIAELVLEDNYLQTETISLEEYSAGKTVDLFHRYIVHLEKQGKINRELEGLPTDEEIATRKISNQGFTRPEIAVLIAYDKILLKQEILASDLPEDPYFVGMLRSAFPKILATQYGKEMQEHSLKREIIATQLSNFITNAMGIYFVSRLTTETGAKAPFVIRAFVAVQALLGLDDIWEKIRVLDNQVAAEVQASMMLELYFLARRSTRWFLRNYSEGFSIELVVKTFAQPFAEAKQHLESMLTEQQVVSLQAEEEKWVKQGVPSSLAREIACYTYLYNALDIMQASQESDFTQIDVGKAYFFLSETLQLNWLHDKLSLQPMENQWEELVRSSLLDELDYQQRLLALHVLKYAAPDKPLALAFECWREKYTDAYQRWSDFFVDLLAMPATSLSFVVYTVMLKELAVLARLSC